MPLYAPSGYFFCNPGEHATISNGVCCCYVEFIVAVHVDDDERLSLAQCLISFYTANRAARLYTVIYRHLSVALKSVVRSVISDYNPYTSVDVADVVCHILWAVL